MNREEIIDHIIALLRQHEGNENKVRLSGSIHQEPYKVDFFKLFAAAFNAGMMANDPQPQDYLSADALADILAERAPDVVDRKTFGDLHAFWQEWTYAWKHSDELHR